MLKKINRILKLVGLNLVRAKRRKVVAWQTLERYTPEDKVPPTTSATVPLADYMGDSEWHNAPGPTGNVGCCGGPVGCDLREQAEKNVLVEAKKHLSEIAEKAIQQEVARLSQPCSGVSTPCFTDNIALGAAALLSVDCGTENMCFGAPDHEIIRAEHFDTAGGTTPEQNEARFETPRVEQPNSDNKITGPTS